MVVINNGHVVVGWVLGWVWRGSRGTPWWEFGFILGTGFSFLVRERYRGHWFWWRFLSKRKNFNFEISGDAGKVCEYKADICDRRIMQRDFLQESLISLKEGLRIVEELEVSGGFWQCRASCCLCLLPFVRVIDASQSPVGRFDFPFRSFYSESEYF